MASSKGPRKVNGNGRKGSLVVTNLMKLAGVALGLSEGFQKESDAKVIALAALMVTGGQALETLVDRILGR